MLTSPNAPFLAHAPRVLRVGFTADGSAPEPMPYLDESALSFAPGSGPFALTLDEGGRRFTISLGGRELLSGERAEGEEGPRVHLVGPSGARLYGFGAATGSLRKSHQRFELMTRDTLFYELEGTSYTAFPFFLCVHPQGSVGVLLTSTYPAWVRTGSVDVDVRYRSQGEPHCVVDLLVLTGGVDEILDDYTKLTGRPFLPPLWSLGFQQCRWSYKSEKKVLEIARRFRREDLPCDVLYLDIHYMDAYRVFTFDPKAFPRPRAMHETLEADGFRTVAIVDPGVSKADYPAYRDGKEKGVFLKTSSGDDYVGRVWPGDTVFPDFTREDAREYWARHHAILFDAGVSGIWNDMNDPVLKVGRVYEPLDEDIVHQGGSHRRFRNLYANLMAEASERAFALYRPEERPFLLTRSGFPGIQKRAAVWTGDNYSSWGQLRENLSHVLSLGLAGVPFAGADIGGFGGRRGRLGVVKLRVERELFARWLELGVWMPLCRVHTVLYSPSQEPWSYGRQVLSIARRLIRRRYRFLPYFYALFREAHERGLPVVRPLFLHDEDSPDDENASRSGGSGADQAFLGRDVLLAPVLERRRRAREVWLPRGGWYDERTLERLEGGRRVKRPAPLGGAPVLVREGAVLPLFAAARNAEDARLGPLFLEVYAGPREVALSGRAVFDDGHTRAHERGAYLDVRFSGQSGPEGLRLDVTRAHDGFLPPQEAYELRLLSAPSEVRVDGREVPFSARALDDEDREARVWVARVPLSARTVDVRWA